MNFRPDVWAKEVKKTEKIKRKYNVKEGEVIWLLDHWRYPFTDHPLAKHLIKMWNKK